MTTLFAEAQAALFDFDGTMADSEPLWYRACRDVFARRGHHVEASDYWLHWSSRGEGVAGELARHGLRFDTDEVAAIERERLAAYRAACGRGEIRLYPEMFQALDSLLAAGLPCAIASNTEQADLHAVLRAAGRRAPACPIVGHPSGTRAKPAPDIFLHAAAALGVSPTDCLVLEDTEKGLTAARAAGMDCVVVRTPYNGGAEFSTAAWVAEDHGVLAAALLRWAALRRSAS